MRKFTCLLIVFLSGFFGAYAQSFSVSGTITDENKMPLLGVNVIVKNESRGTTTDFDGNYTVQNISSGDVLQFSYLGFQTQEITVNDQQTINVTLQTDSEALNEVVVIGYGTQSRKEITGAVSVVGSETIEDLNPARVEQALQGRVAGVNITSTSGSPGSASTINIRGISTNGDNRPLILVDGNVIEDLSVINPNDIESINVLKDATAGIYGVRAANGVILITTKTGSYNADLQVEFDAYTGVQQTTRRLPALNATEYAVIVNEAYAAAGQNPPYPNYRNLGEGTDYQDEVFTTAPMSDMNLNISGGGDRSKYSFGASYFNQDGIVGGSKSNYDRFTGRVNYNLEIIDNLKLNLSGIYTNSNRKTLAENALGSVLFNAVNMNPNIPVRDADGNFSLAEGLGNEVVNPLAQINNAFNDTRVDKISGVGGLEYTIWDKLTAKTQFQFNYSEVDGRYFSPEVFYGSGKVFNVDRNNVTENFEIYRDYTWDNFLTYNDSFGDHNLKWLLGMSVFKTTGDLASLTGFELPSNEYDAARVSNAAEVVDNYQNGGDTFDTRLLSYFTRVQYDYEGKYLFSGLIRRDGSTAFGPENKFGWFPSASVGWVISDEDFINDNGTLNFLKLRGSYGIIGNDRIPAFRYASLLNGEGAYVFNDEIIFGKASGALGNPEIKWEKQKTLDIGLDARFFNSSIDVTIDYFKKKTEDLLVIPQVSGILGVAAPGSSAPFVNGGGVENEGLEFSIGYNQVVNDNFKFNVNYNLTALRNEVLYVNSESGLIPGGVFGIGQEPPSRMEPGKPIGYFYGLETNGIFQTQAEVDAAATQANAAPGDIRFVDQNGDGVIDSDDRTDIGDPIPDLTMGANIGFTFKNWDFNAYAFASLGNEIVRNFERNQPNTNRTNAFLGRWTGPGTTDSFPRVTVGATSNNQFSDFFVEDGSYLRLQNVQVGYTLDSDLIANTGVEKFRVYASVNNAFTLTEYSGYDPSASNGAPIGGGIDQGFYPVPRIYMLGINLKF
ncbi:TonB-dependent receptor [Christiangramia sp. OXR-203]|jgi:TonB-linked SusC/RagA family outer membrane protein|uniref:SusC/RagA family TonB-linked outer membrane protein n=1 Tax=Christiangramia sp. OXR-203 TaxID=3100176 RepID=UPI002AC8CA4E|nr:TonB-dependent receptor [Christiangramia sp. OXR-203]WPY98559.1 TonB-dependent receptor [Christiangramia sp. OXR-203]